jgi:hypothetical protein
MSSLGEFHHSEDGPTRTSKIIAGIVVAAIVGGIAFYVVDSGMLHSQPTTQSYPRGL